MNRYPPGWRKMSLAIRRIANYQCEWCGVPLGAPLPSGRKGKVVLSVAHLGAPLATGDGWTAGDKHDKRDVRRENLACLCAGCHLRFDIDEHVEHARETRQRKKREAARAAGQLELFPGEKNAEYPA
jgi:hypothetical protein